MQVNRPHLRAFAWILLVHGDLREVPRAMNMVRAKVQGDPPTVGGARFQTIRGRLATDLIARDQP